MSSSAPTDDGRARSPWQRRLIFQGVLLVVAFVSLYLLLPSLVEVFSSWRSLTTLNPLWAGLALVAEAASFASAWALQRVALRTKAWFAVATSQLASTAFGRVIPGGGTTAAAFQVGLLRRAGIGGGRAAAVLAATGALTMGAMLALPLLSLPAILGGVAVARSLEVTAYLGLIVLVLLLAGGAVAFAADRPLRFVARIVQAGANSTIRRRRPISRLGDKVLLERDFIRDTLGRRWLPSVAAAIGVPLFDFAALLLALAAVGARPRPSLVLLAYVMAQLLAWIPITPGGLGFVEAGLVSTLTLAGVGAGPAGLATLFYRLLSFWLPIPVGGLAYLAFRHRYGSVPEIEADAPA